MLVATSEEVVVLVTVSDEVVMSVVVVLSVVVLSVEEVVLSVVELISAEEVKVLVVVVVLTSLDEVELLPINELSEAVELLREAVLDTVLSGAEELVSLAVTEILDEVAVAVLYRLEISSPG